MRFVARLQGDLDDGPVRAFEPGGRPLQPQSPNVLVQRLAHHAAKDAVKMVRREMGDPGVLVQ